MNDHILIWLTRPQTDSALLAEQLAAHAIPTVISEVMHIENNKSNILLEKPQEEYQAILLTSRHAAMSLSHLPKGLEHCPVFCVGDATAAVASVEGMKTVIAGDKDVTDLLPKLIESVTLPARILYLAGEQTRVDVATLLSVQGVTVETHVVYLAKPVEAFSPELLKALAQGKVHGVVFYSPRSALLAEELLAAQNLPEAAKQIEAYCLSLAVAQAAARAGWKAIHACFTPTNAAMLDLVVSRAQAVL